ncbi:putative Spindle and kinetochore-associated protein 2-like [Homarus americanus]|uniref:Putative Spindle and kinetochore-associated protein 2-like n=1 Tax=Homarus americanus TaxID=6706 RepID=A0A8J5MJY2_HOMAM|nr:putative Spindle and kinetochore-associated protein 2-like [Homarus americanus]
MEPAVEKLEILFGKAESELATLSCKVDQEYTALASAQRSNSQVPSGLIRNVQNLRSELNQVSVEVLEFQKQQQAVMLSMQAQLNTLCSQFDDLSSLTGQAAVDEGSGKEKASK